MNPLAKRYLLGIPKAEICKVYGVSEEDVLLAAVFQHCADVNPAHVDYDGETVTTKPTKAEYYDKWEGYFVAHGERWIVQPKCGTTTMRQVWGEYEEISREEFAKRKEPIAAIVRHPWERLMSAANCPHCRNVLITKPGTDIEHFVLFNILMQREIHSAIRPCSTAVEGFDVQRWLRTEDIPQHFPGAPRLNVGDYAVQREMFNFEAWGLRGMYGGDIKLWEKAENRKKVREVAKKVESSQVADEAPKQTNVAKAATNAQKKKRGRPRKKVAAKA